MKRNYIYNLIITVFNILFPVLSFPYAARILGPSGIGKIQFVSNFAQYFALIAALGLPFYGVREIAKVKNDKNKLSKTFSELLYIYIITSVLFTVIFIVITVSVNRFNVDFKYYLTASSLILLGFCSVDWFYQGLEQFKTIAIRSIVVKLISLILLYTLVKNKNDLFIYMVITVFSFLGNNLMNMLILSRSIAFQTKELNVKRHIKPLIYILASTLSMAMYALFDTVLLGLLSDEKSVGFYTAGVKISKITLPLVTSIGGALIPQISRSFASNQKQFNQIITLSFEFIIIISIPISFGLLVLAPEMIYVFSGPDFHRAVLPMQILSFLPFLIGMGNLFGVQILITAAKEKEMLISVATGMFVSLLGNILLVPPLKEIGGAISNTLTELIVALMFFYFVRKNFEINLSGKVIINSVLVSILFIPIVIGLRLIITNSIAIIAASFLLCSLIYIIATLFVFKNELLLSYIKGSIFKRES